MSEDIWVLFSLRHVMVAVGMGLAVSACVPASWTTRTRDIVPVAASAHETFSERNLNRLKADIPPGVLSLADRRMPGRKRDFWGRPTGWAVLDLGRVPDPGFSLPPSPEVAEDLNALRPFSTLPIRPMRPFVLTASVDDTGRAMTCLTQAVYYEAGQEPRIGQEAIAQVVLNRLRHPAYPKSVCGVVYQGASRTTGCQFTFACDGSLDRPPVPALWSQAESIARAALGGHVVKEVGTATHYHAGYVFPYWAPTLVKLVKLGQHIFYRWTGPGGETRAFAGRYAGGEAYVSPAILGSLDVRTQGLLDPAAEGLPAGREVSLGAAGEVRTYTVTDPMAAGGQRMRIQGTLIPSRRRPTPEEIQQINAALARLEKGDAEDTSPDPAKP